MAGTIRTRLTRLLSGVACCLLVAGAVFPDAPVARATKLRADCAALGTYVVGSLLPLPQGTGGAPTAILPGYGSPLRGTLTISGYTGCGTPTSGTFLVYGLARPLTGVQPIRPGGQAIGSRIVPIFGGTGVLTATGTITQDPAHASDPTYLAVAATVVYGRYGYGCPPLCTDRGGAAQACPATGCTAAVAVTRTAAFGSVTGFLRLQLGVRSTVGIAFLPPPDPAAANPALAMQLQPVTFVGYKAG